MELLSVSNFLYHLDVEKYQSSDPFKTKRSLYRFVHGHTEMQIPQVPSVTLKALPLSITAFLQLNVSNKSSLSIPGAVLNAFFALSAEGFVNGCLLIISHHGTHFILIITSTYDYGLI